MKFPAPVSVKWLAAFIGATVYGNDDELIAGINEIHRVEDGDIVFVDHPKYYNKCLQSNASFVIIDQLVQERFGKTLLVHSQPFEAYLQIANHFKPFVPAESSISSSAKIGENTIIMPNVFMGNHVSIGSNCIIHPNTCLYDFTSIGNNVIIHAGCTIGADAFYYNGKKNREVWYKKMASCGQVIIEDDVEIGANTCIDKGVTSNTIIGKGTKIDNLVQVGHDVVIGMNCIVAAQVGIAGATTIGNGVTLWGQVGVSKTLTIGDNVQVLAQSGVGGSIDANEIFFGSPAENARIKKRELVWQKRMPEIWERLIKLENRYTEFIKSL